MSRLFNFAYKNAQEDSASAIENIKKSCRSLLAVAVVSSVVLTGVVPVGAAFAAEAGATLICVTPDAETALCASDSGTSGHELGGVNGYPLDSNNTGESAITGGKVVTSKDGGEYTHTLYDDEGNKVGVINNENGDGFFSIKLDEGVSVVIRVQESNTYKYWEVTGDGENTYKVNASSNSGWLKSLTVPAADRNCEIEGKEDLSADDPECEETPVVLREPVYECVSLELLSDKVEKGETATFKITASVNGNDYEVTEGYKIDFGDGKEAVISEDDTIDYVYETLPGEGEIYNVVASVNVKTDEKAYEYVTSDNCMLALEGKGGITPPEVPETGAVVESAETVGVVAEYAAFNSDIVALGLIGATGLLIERKYKRAVKNQEA